MRKSPLERIEKAVNILEEESFKMMANRSENSSFGAWINWNTSNIRVTLLMLRAGVYNLPKLEEKLGLQDNISSAYPANDKEESK